MVQDNNAGSGAKTPAGRDCHKECFSIWMAGGRLNSGLTWGAMGNLGFGITENEVHVYDLHAPCLHLLGIDLEQLTYRHQGRGFRLTNVHGRVVGEILA